MITSMIPFITEGLMKASFSQTQIGTLPEAEGLHPYLYVLTGPKL